MKLNKTIRILREKANLTQKEVAKRAHTPQAYISQIEIGVRVPSERMLEDILIKGIGLPYPEAQKIIREWKLERMGFSPELADLVDTDFVLVPILGEVPCGDPKKELKDAEDHISLPKSLAPKGHHIFAVKADGVSMVEENIMPGDTIICDADAKVKNGDLAIVRLKNKVTLKRLFFRKGYVELQPANKGFKSIKARHLEVVGKIIYHIKKFK